MFFFFDFLQGLPLHIQIDTFEDHRDAQIFHRGYCQIKVFCDKVSIVDFHFFLIVRCCCYFTPVIYLLICFRFGNVNLFGNVIMKWIHEFALKEKKLLFFSTRPKKNPRWKKIVQNIPPEFIIFVRKDIETCYYCMLCLSDGNSRHHNISQTYSYQ